MNIEVPMDWRVAVEKIKPPGPSYADNIPDEMPEFENYQNILDNDTTLKYIDIKRDKTEKMIESAEYLIDKIKECKEQLQLAEDKRKVISANAELIHGECDSQLAAEQRLSLIHI